ncbi:MAG: hypothetical protein P8X64_16925 [Anaerolineales bacterium]|jgi:hypothetical protein
MISYGAMDLISAAMRRDRERQAVQDRTIRQCNATPGFLERILRKFMVSIGRALEAIGDWLQKQAGRREHDRSGEYSMRDVNYG